MMIAVGQRVDYQRHGYIFSGVIESVDYAPGIGTFYWVRDDADQVRTAVPQQQIIR